MGLEPVEKLTDMQNQMKAMGIEKAIEINQTAYERYLNRK